MLLSTQKRAGLDTCLGLCASGFGLLGFTQREPTAPVNAIYAIPYWSISRASPKHPSPSTISRKRFLQRRRFCLDAVSPAVTPFDMAWINRSFVLAISLAQSVCASLQVWLPPAVIGSSCWYARAVTSEAEPNLLFISIN